MSIRINNLTLSIDDNKEVLAKKICKKLKISDKDIKKLTIIKESLDARKKNEIKFNYCVDIKCDNEKKIVSKIKDNDVRLQEEDNGLKIEKGDVKLNHRPVIVGFGPAGMFAALTLAKNGYKPIVFERGEDVDSRTNAVKSFWETGNLNIKSNVQFGEGGAGAFSDGKLTTRIKDPKCAYILDELISA